MTHGTASGYATFGARLRAARAAAGFTQAGLGVDIDRTATCISYWESDKREPSLKDLAALSAALNTSLDVLILGEQCGTIAGVNQVGPSDGGTSSGPVPNPVEVRNDE